LEFPPEVHRGRVGSQRAAAQPELNVRLLIGSMDIGIGGRRKLIGGGTLGAGGLGGEQHPCTEAGPSRSEGRETARSCGH